MVVCLVYCFLLISLTESRPGPLEPSVLVLSARMINVSELTNVRFFESAVAWLT